MNIEIISKLHFSSRERSVEKRSTSKDVGFITKWWKRERKDFFASRNWSCNKFQNVFPMQAWFSSEITRAQITRRSSFKTVACSSRTHNEHGGALVMATDDIIGRYHVDDFSNHQFLFSVS